MWVRRGEARGETLMVIMVVVSGVMVVILMMAMVNAGEGSEGWVERGGDAVVMRYRGRVLSSANTND